MGNKGLRQYTGDEVGNIFLGQMGFDLVTNKTVATTDAGAPPRWVAIKVVNGNATSVKALSFIGDDLTDDGTSTGNALALVDGDIIYGCFSSITIGSGDHILAYRG